MEGIARSFKAHSSDIDLRGAINSLGSRISSFAPALEMT